MAAVACDHCGLSFDLSAMIVDDSLGERRHFCCKGCQGVYHLLREEGLEGFYERKGGTTLVPPTQSCGETEHFDLESFRKRFVTERPDGLNEVFLILEGIHCAACVWLNEKVLHATEGVIEVSINFTTNKAKVVWDPAVVKLSHIIDKIRSIGYNAYPYDASSQEHAVNRARKEYYYRMVVAIFATMNVMWIAIAQYAGYFQGIDAGNKLVLTVAEFVLATPTLFYSGWVYFRGAWYGLRNRIVTMDLLVATGASLAWGYSVWAMLNGHEAYFDSVTMIVTFVLVGKFLEVLARKSAVDTLDRLMAAIPLEVIVLRDGVRVAVAPEEVRVGETMEVRPGERIVIDGEILEGCSSIDESPLTGEPLPVVKEKGMSVAAGTVVIDGLLRIRAQKLFADSTLSVILRLLEESLEKKPKIEQLANRLSGYFSSTILFIAALTFVGWSLGLGVAFDQALMVTVSVIIIACPCALALATPIATLVGLGAAARRGIVFKAASTLETMAQATVLIVDKTGTITKGRPEVVAEYLFAPLDWSLVRALVASSTHPISRGIVRWIDENGKADRLCDAQGVEALQARGVRAIVEGVRLSGGNARMMEEVGIPLPEQAPSERLLYYIAVEGAVCACLELEDRLKPGAYEAIGYLEGLGLRVVMATGDHAASARRIAEEAGIAQVHADLSPAGKLALVEAFQAEGAKVVMAGDGINDALALAKSDVAIAMGEGAQLAMDVSDVVLLSDNLKGVVDAFVVARRTYGFIKQNLALSLGYNAVTIPLAVAGYVIPLVAAISMSFSSLLVVGNSMRIKRGLD